MPAPTEGRPPGNAGFQIPGTTPRSALPPDTTAQGSVPDSRHDTPHRV